MKLLEKILVPIDVSSYSKAQINATIKMASAYRSEVILLSVIPDEELKDNIKSLVKKTVADSLNKIKKTLSVEKITVKNPIIVFGKPIDCIIQIANKEHVNLILIGGANVNKKGDKYKLGIIAEQLVRMSDVPMWVIKPDEKISFSNILCPVDFSEPSKRALYNAILLTRNFQSTLNILSVYEPITGLSKKISSHIEEENTKRLKAAKSKMTSFLKNFDLKGVNYNIVFKSGVVHDKILSAIKKLGINLLVMGTNGRSGLSRFFMGSVTGKVIREMPCSFITTQTHDIIQLKLSLDIKEIETHFKNGNELVKNGFYKEAINQFMVCLQINQMHIPSMYKLAEINKIIGDEHKSAYYENMAKDILARLWDIKIEAEIRKLYHVE